MLRLELFCARPQAIHSMDGSTSGFVDAALAETGRSRNVVLALPHFHGIALSVARSGLIAAVPKQYADFVAADLKLAVFQPPVDVVVPEVKMHWHSATTMIRRIAGCAQKSSAPWCRCRRRNA